MKHFLYVILALPAALPSRTPLRDGLETADPPTVQNDLANCQMELSDYKVDSAILNVQADTCNSSLVATEQKLLTRTDNLQTCQNNII
ncbi:hypothetical protein BJX70DRAFT_369523 [Aspergillus crustosus]